MKYAVIRTGGKQYKVAVDETITVERLPQEVNEEFVSSEVLLVNDSDILVSPGYFRTVVASLEDPRIGLATCLYRAHSDSWASHNSCRCSSSRL